MYSFLDLDFRGQRYEYFLINGQIITKRVIFNGTERTRTLALG